MRRLASNVHASWFVYGICRLGHNPAVLAMCTDLCSSNSEKFYYDIATAAMGEWSGRPRVPAFEYSDPEHGLAFLISAMGDTIPWDVVADIASRLWQCASRGLPYLLDASYGTPNRRIMVMVSVRLFEAAVESVGSNSVTWTSDPNGLPGDDLLRGAREGSVPSINSDPTWPHN